MKEVEHRLHVFVHVNCNNNCLFCLDHFRPGEPFVYEPGKKAVNDEDVIGQLARYLPTTNKMLFTTGEPTLHPGLPRFVAIAREMGYTEIGLITNGRMLAYLDLCEKLFAAGLNRISVSIHGHTSVLHDSHTRAKGSFAQAVAGMLNILSFRGKHIFTLNTSSTITSMNVAHLYDMITFFRRFIHDGQMILNPTIPIGAALKFPRKALVRITDVATAIRSAKQRFTEEEGAPPPNLIVMDMPYCIMPADLPTLAGREHIVGGKEFEEINEHNIPVCTRTKRPECKQCGFDTVCPGVYTQYTNYFGWEEFVPVCR